MANEEQEVLLAAERFYAAIEEVSCGNGLNAMRDAWHHTARVTSRHPSGDWAQGWDEVWATWEVFASFGRADRGGSKVSDLRANVYGDIAYTTCHYRASPAKGGESLACTNVLQRIDGVWKVIHHHADKSAALTAALERIAMET